MRATLERMLTQIREYFGKLSRRSRILIGVLTLVVIAIAVVAVVFLSRTNYVVLTTAQTPAEAGDIYNALTDMGVPAKVEGTRVLVPENRAGELGAILSSAGVMGPTAPSLEILNLAASFNVTDSHAKKLYEYQRANDIRTLVMQSDRIQNAIVIVNAGQSSTFARIQNTNMATCAVMLTINNAATLTDGEAQAIAEIVSNSVQGIKYENITITDSNLHRYKIGDDLPEESFDDVIGSRLTLKNLIQKQLQEQGEQLLIPIFGMRNVEVGVRVELDFDKVVIESVKFDPPVAGEEDGIARSSSDIWEAVRKDPIAEGIPGTDTNAMGTIEYPYGTLNDNDYYARMVRERNYEINETRTLIEKEQGKIESLYISVTVNSLATEEDYTTQVTNLISRGMGIPLANVAVERLPFSHKDTSLQDMFDRWKEYDEQLKRQELIEMIITGAVILLLGIAIVVLVGTIWKGTRPVPEPVPVPADGPTGMFDFIVGDEEEAGVSEDGVDEIGVQKKSTGLEQIERFIDKDPAAVAQLLRNWLTDE